MVGNVGTVESFTLQQMPPEGFEPPLLLVLVRLDDGPTVLCSGDPSLFNTLSIGMRVSVTRGTDGRYHVRL